MPQLLLGKSLGFVLVNQLVKIANNFKKIKFHCMSIIGIRDSNDEVVAATLRALADIVPALGATTVRRFYYLKACVIITDLDVEYKTY